MTPNWFLEYQQEIHTAIDTFFTARYHADKGVEQDFENALRYAVEGGGKRIRPLLALLAFEYTMKKYGRTSQIERATLIEGLLGLEFIHCFTLVHDDLPCMDNDELRRGKPTVWKVYGETMAILVGDTLQTLGMENLALLGDIRVIVEITGTIGDFGVARGQVRDTLLLQKDLELSELLRLHDEKTGGFISSSLVIGCLIAGGTEEDCRLLRQFGMLLGRAFQIQDDILDFEGDSTLLGKKAGKDVALGKGIVASQGIDVSKNILKGIENEILQLSETFSFPQFDEVRDFIIKRVV